MFVFAKILYRGKRTPTSVRRRSSRVDFRLRNPSSPDVVFVMKALFSILDPQNRVETNTCFVFAHDFVLASRYLYFFRCLPILQTPKIFCDASFSRMADYNYNIVTPPRNFTGHVRKFDMRVAYCLVCWVTNQRSHGKIYHAIQACHVNSLICKLQHFRFLPTRRNGQLFL